MVEYGPTPPSSRGPGRGPFKAKTGVRIPMGACSVDMNRRVATRLAGFIFRLLALAKTVIAFAMCAVRLAVEMTRCHSRQILARDRIEGKRQAKTGQMSLSPYANLATIKLLENILQAQKAVLCAVLEVKDA